MDHFPAPVVRLASVPTVTAPAVTVPDSTDGATLAVYLPPGTPQRVLDLLHQQVAGLLSRTRRGYGPQVAWRPGNPLDLPE